jgi:hypothetical protein
VAQIFRAKGEAFRRSHNLTAEQVKAMLAIERCRTEALGGHVDVCESCGDMAISYNSCRNRHCPKCQSLAQAQWIEEREGRILPTHHFHVVFTLPAALRPLARRAPAAIYDLLFECASNTLLELGRDPKFLGGQLGLTAVLHTWTRRLEFHPHLHCIVTGGGLSPKGDRWVAARGKDRFLFPVTVLSALFRGKFMAGLARAFAAGELHVDPNDAAEQSTFEALRNRVYKHAWVVYAKRPFGGARHVFRYLGRYTHRVGISNQRLREITDEQVTFVTKSGKSVTLSHDVFIRRFLMHVLPPRFTKIRHFGLMASTNASTKLEIARRLLDPARVSVAAAQPDEGWQDFHARLTGKDLRECPSCGGRVHRFALNAFRSALPVPLLRCALLGGIAFALRILQFAIVGGLQFALGWLRFGLGRRTLDAGRRLGLHP